MFALHTVVLTLASAACLCAATVGGEVRELALEVQGRNPAELLPECFVVEDTPADRDVGTFLQHPEKSECNVEARSLDEIGGSAPDAIQVVRILMKESGNPTEPPPTYRIGQSAGGASKRRLNGLVNPTAATTLQGWMNRKYQALKAWMSSQSSTSLMIVHESGEVLFAGCNESTIRRKYDQIISASGGTQSIVLAGELSPFHYGDAWWYDADFPDPNTDDRRSDFLTNMAAQGCSGCTNSWARDYADCSPTPGPKYCSDPAKYQFASPGLIMGTVGSVSEMLSELEKWDSTLERFVTQYFLKHKSDVAIDYAGVLVLSLHNMKLDSNPPVRVETDANGEKFFLNTASTNEPVCFLHGDGNSFAHLQQLAAEILQ